MAKSSKNKGGNSKVAASVTDAEEVIMPEDEQTPNVDSEQSTELSDVPDDEDGIGMEDLDETLDDNVELAADEIEPAADVMIEDPAPEPVPEEITNTAAEPPANAGAGFFPMLLGGVAAGAIGYGIATYFPTSSGSDDLTTQLAAQAEQIAALETQLSEVPTVDLSGVEAQITTVAVETASQFEALSATVEDGLSELDARILDVERRPNSDGTLSDTALAAYQRELEELRADLDAQQETVMSAATLAEADLAAARAEAEALEQAAIASAEAAAARAALNRVATAVETGAPFDDALADLDLADLPAALADAGANGVATSAELTADFPAAARAALAAARSEGVSDDASGIGGFLRQQFDVRSTAPQEGPGPDAVLSRAEAAMKEGRVTDTLAEIEALPEVARAAITDWTARAQKRADVLDAIATLSETYN